MFVNIAFDWCRCIVYIYILSKMGLEFSGFRGMGPKHISVLNSTHVISYIGGCFSEGYDVYIYSGEALTK